MEKQEFITTIGENDNVPQLDESSTDEEDGNPKESSKKNKKNRRKSFPTNRSGDFNDEFHFDFEDEDFQSWASNYAMEYAKRKSEASTLDEKIANVRRKKKVEQKEVLTTNTEEPVDNESEADTDASGEISSSEEETVPDKVKTKEKKKKKKKKKGFEEEEEEGEKIKFSDEVESYDKTLGFNDMNLSRPLLKALTTMQWSKPTPIQVATIPMALMGKDICACAATGTGKTGAFMLPVLERLIYKPKQAPVTRVLVLTPTRELAIQIHSVSKQLAQYTNIDISLSAGGLDLKAQEAALRLGPDVVIATPGRLIDHLHNSPNFTLKSIEILILDEADRMLDEYFAEQMKEVIRLCSQTRQTMLFSATMSEQVKDLAAVSLKNPVKIFINENTEVALNLRQEFVRIRPNREGDREAVVAALVKRTFHDHCIVFIQTKRQAHRMHILLGLLGIRVGELHGNLSQLQRLEALKKFKECEIDVLLATDLASRGLDIPDVKTVINFTMPNSLKHYIHRVGRTARAGKSGRSVTLVGEKERKLLKEVVKSAKNPLKSRVLPQEIVNKYVDKLKSLEKDVTEIMKLEKEEKQLQFTENKMNKAEKLLHEKNDTQDIKRGWFQTHQERQQEAAALRLGDFTKLPSNQKKKAEIAKEILKKRPTTAEERAEFEMEKSAAYAARDAKRARKPKRMHVFDEEEEEEKAPKKKKKKSGNKKSSFAQELTNTSKKSLKKYRAGPELSYQEKKQRGLIKAKKGNSKSKSRFKRRR